MVVPTLRRELGLEIMELHLEYVVVAGVCLLDKESHLCRLLLYTKHIMLTFTPPFFLSYTGYAKAERRQRTKNGQSPEKRSGGRRERQSVDELQEGRFSTLGALAMENIGTGRQGALAFTMFALPCRQ